MKKLVLMLLAFASIILMVYSKPKADKSQTAKRVLMIIAPTNFRDEELLVPEKMFKAQGMKVTIASTVTTPVKGMLKVTVIPDMPLDNVRVNNYDAVVFVGGVGARFYYTNQQAKKIAQATVKARKILGAICLAPNILAKAGVLKGKQATCWNANILIKNGVDYQKKRVVVDGNIITANGPRAAKAFALAIINALKQ